MRCATALLLVALLAGCAQPPRDERTIDPEPWLEGVARPEPVEPDSFPYDPPPEPYVYEEERVVIRGLEDEDLTALDRGERRNAPSLGASEDDLLIGDEGVWLDGEYYPGAVYHPGEFEEFVLEDDGYYVMGGVLTGIDGPLPGYERCRGRRRARERDPAPVRPAAPSEPEAPAASAPEARPAPAPAGPRRVPETRPAPERREPPKTEERRPSPRTPARQPDPPARREPPPSSEDDPPERREPPKSAESRRTPD